MRLFVAIELSDRIRSKLKKLQGVLGRTCDGIRWIPPGNLHITVKFIGEVKDPKIVEITEAVARAATQANPFTMRVSGCGCFPKAGPVRIAWVGLEDPTGALLRCVEALECEMETLGYPRERRPFSAHVTIGRARADRSDGMVRSIIDEAGLEPVEQKVSSLSLMTSTLSPQGPTYVRVSSAKLGGNVCPTN